MKKTLFSRDHRMRMWVAYDASWCIHLCSYANGFGVWENSMVGAVCRVTIVIGGCSHAMPKKTKKTLEHANAALNAECHKMSIRYNGLWYGTEMCCTNNRFVPSMHQKHHRISFRSARACVTSHSRIYSIYCRRTDVSLSVFTSRPRLSCPVCALAKWKARQAGKNGKRWNNNETDRQTARQTTFSIIALFPEIFGVYSFRLHKRAIQQIVGTK